MAKDNRITLYDLQLRTGATISPFVWATKYAIAHEGSRSTSSPAASPASWSAPAARPSACPPSWMTASGCWTAARSPNTSTPPTPTGPGGLGRHPGLHLLFGLKLRDGDPEPFSKAPAVGGLAKRNRGPDSTREETERMQERMRETART